MSALLAPVPVAKFWDNNGLPLFKGKLATYAAGTTTPQATYIDSTQTTQNTNPVILNARGECNLWLDPTLTYKFVLTDVLGSVISTVDNIPGGFSPSAIAASLIPKPTNTWNLGSSSFTWANLYLGASGIPLLDPTTGNILFYARTPAEVAAGVTPVNYSYAPGNVLRYGTNTTPGTTDMTAAITAALAVAAVGNGGSVLLPRGLIKHTGLTVSGNGVSLIGAAKGAGTSESTVLQYTGSGVGIAVNGSYCRLADFSQDNLGTGTVGIQMNGNQILCERVSLTGQSGSAAWSSAAFQSNPSSVSFTHTLRNCYALGHNIGWDVAQGNNMCADNSFFESNKTNIQVGRIATVFGFSFVNQSVAELFGDGRSDEIAGSISIDIIACDGFEIRGGYFEADGTGNGSSTAQCCVNLRAGAQGGVIESNYMQGGGAAVGAIVVADSAVSGVVIRGNAFKSFNGYGVIGATGGSPAQCSISDNAALSGTTGEYNDSLTLQLQFGGAHVGLTTSNSSASWQRIGKFVILKGVIQLTAVGSSTGTATISGLSAALGHLSTAGTEDSAALTVQNLSTVSGGCTVQITSGAPTTINLLSAGAGGAQVALTNSNFGNTAYLNFTLTYQVAA